MTAADKETIYIDIDDEITGIIDKLKGSKGKIVALVLPKRAGVFQSIVNMKLLKRAADESKKHLVLITSEAGLLPLAGAAGVHVAKTLNSKPEIPLAPTANDDEESVDEDEDITDDLDTEKTVGELAGAGAAATVGADGVETLELDDDDLPEDLDKPAPAAKSFKPKDGKGKKDKKLAIPNFERFRLLLIGGGILLVLLIIGLVFAMSVLPKATITIDTDASNVNTNANLALSTTAKTFSSSGNTVPAKVVTQQKTYTQQANASGQKNNGNKASGSVTLTNCSDSDVVVPAGNGVSSGGNTYITQTTVDVPSSDFTSKGQCKDNGKATVGVMAQNGGASYNISSGSNVSVSGFGSLSGQSGNISGGTDNIVKIVSQSDIDSAKAKINTDDPTTKQNLQNQLKQAGYYAIVTTFSAGTPAVTSSANAGDAANTVTVTENVTYTMFGAKEADLKEVVDNDVKSQIDTGKQSILDEGLDKASFNVTSATATDAKVSMATVAVVGPDLSTDTIKQEAAGKKPGDVKSSVGSNPDVKSVDVKLSPFWVNSVPKKQSKITVTIAKPDAKASSNDSSKP